jgi:16S rRNA (guanine527-N7)-methyltransferase
MKGSTAAEEVKDAGKAVTTLGGKIEAENLFELLTFGGRGIINVKKISQTPTKYPRNSGKISKQPL